jgi:micrococcal nuclease
MSRRPGRPSLARLRPTLPVDALLVAEGLAQAATYPPDVKDVEAFLAAQRDARAAGRGLWSTP